MFTPRMIAALSVVFALLGSHTVAYVKGKHSEREAWQAKQYQAGQDAQAQKDAWDELSRQLVKRYQEKENQANDYYRKWRNEIARNTTGRVCLDPGAVSVWDASLRGEGDLPGPSAGTSKAPSATDTAVLGNAIDNFEQYAECRRQLNALIDWHEKTR